MEPKKYFDYEGNEIKEGMTIFLVSTKSPFSQISGRSINKTEPDFVVDIPTDEFRVILKGKVIMKNSIMYVEFKGTDVTMRNPLQFVIDGLSNNQVISIKETK